MVDEAPSPESVVRAAVSAFARRGYSGVKLDSLAKKTGMTKRMIHYHFGDKRGLYTQAILLAIDKLRPIAQDMELESTVPVDGVRKVVQAISHRIHAEPDALRLILMENLHPHLDHDSALPIAAESEVILQLNKLLMLGQDSGAFRPGISALDVYTIIAALRVFPASYHSALLNLYDTDMGKEENIQGLERLVTDTVVAFLTSNLSDSGETSYLRTEAGTGTKAASKQNDSDDFSVYSDGSLFDDDPSASTLEEFQPKTDGASTPEAE